MNARLIQNIVPEFIVLYYWRRHYRKLAERVARRKALEEHYQKLAEQEAAWREAEYPADRYVVQPGDCLINIANQHNMKLQELLAQNQQIKNPNLIYANQIVSVNYTMHY